MQRPRIVTEHENRSKWLRWLVIGGSVVFTLSLGYAAFTFMSADLYDRYVAMTGDRARLLELRKDLSERLREAQLEKARLREELAYLEKSQQIDHEACQQLRGSLRDMQAQLVDAQEQLAFYRGIVTPEDERKGVRVHDLVVRQDEGEIRWELVLVQGSQRSTGRVRGQMQLLVEGTDEDGAPEQVIVTGAEGESDVLFSFRHFQEFGGVVSFPAGFQPRRIKVTVRRDGDDEARETTHEWQRVLAGQER